AKLLSHDRALIEPASIVVQCLAKQIVLLQNPIDELDAKIDKEMKSPPDAALFTALPGAGKALAPRLLAAFGSQRDRYANAEEVATFSGIAPVTKQSGKSRIVHRRYACPKYLRQTFTPCKNLRCLRGETAAKCRVHVALCFLTRCSFRKSLGSSAGGFVCVSRLGWHC
ncbi:MAG: transposase, partial [Pirellulales bacterium]